MRKETENHWCEPSIADVHKQHTKEHNMLQELQRYALDGKWDEFDELIKEFNEDKWDDLKELCRYPNAKKCHSDSYYEGRTIKYFAWGDR